MSGSKASPPGGADANANDPSMEDILASIRRILSEEEPAAAAPAPAAVPAAAEPLAAEEKPDDVLVLDPSMLVAAEDEAAPDSEPDPGAEPDQDAEPAPGAEQARDTEQASGPAALAEAPAAVEPFLAERAAGARLLAPEAEDAATVSMGNLVRTLATERTLLVHRGGPTIEDIVREELRPLLKQWLDAHLPDLVERLVRAEIERVVHRAVP